MAELSWWIKWQYLFSMPTIVSYKHGLKHTYTVFKIQFCCDFSCIYLFMRRCSDHTYMWICGGHRTTSWSQSSPPIMWLSVVRLMSLNMTASVFINWTILPYPNTTNFGTWMWTSIWLLEREASKIINSCTCFCILRATRYYLCFAYCSTLLNSSSSWTRCLNYF